jgi:SPX domain protein involved in polyphosphate accumulation
MAELERKNVIIKDATKYNRKEFKYLIPNRVVDIIISDILMHMEYDDFSKNGFYPIYSVYFDTLDLQTFSNKMAGLQHRRKFRVRSYNSNVKLSEPVFLEVKEKNGNRIFKRRTPLSLEQVLSLAEDRKSLEIKNSVYEEWKYELIKGNLRPSLLNYYKRLAFVSDVYPGLRITIDRDVSYSRTNSLDFSLPTKKVSWAHEKSVIEIKFDSFVPSFVVDMIRRYGLTAEPVSKYADAIISGYSLHYA